MLVLGNLARTTQPARLVLQTEITCACAFPDLLGMTVKTVLVHYIAMIALSQLGDVNFEGVKCQ